MNPFGSRFTSIVIHNIPSWLDRQAIEDFVKTVPQILRVRHKQTIDRSHFDLLLDFTRGDDVYCALGVSPSNPIITIDHHELPFVFNPRYINARDFKVVSRLVSDPPTPPTPAGAPRPYLKLDGLKEGHGHCNICRSEINGLFSTPCWACRSAVCHDCIRQHFRMALSDYNRFPAQCCGYPFHHDVAKGIMSEDEHTKYKTRFEELITKDPLYCPVPACSAFIPPRLKGKMEDLNINCHACQASICCECRLLAHSDQVCTGRKAEDHSPLEGTEYKACPRCGMALVKIDGCPHIQCKCGLHVCWECGRRLARCQAAPCAAASDHDEDREEEPGPISETENTFDSDDDPELYSNPDDNFDVRGCKHSFGPLLANRVPRYWMTASIPDWWDRDNDDQHIECMMCRSTAKPSEAGRMEDWSVARRCAKCCLVVCGKCEEVVSPALGR